MQSDTEKWIQQFSIYQNLDLDFTSDVYCFLNIRRYLSIRFYKDYNETEKFWRYNFSSQIVGPCSLIETGSVLGSKRFLWQYFVRGLEQDLQSAILIQSPFKFEVPMIYLYAKKHTNRSL